MKLLIQNKANHSTIFDEWNKKKKCGGEFLMKPRYTILSFIIKSSITFVFCSCQRSDKMTNFCCKVTFSTK